MGFLEVFGIKFFFILTYFVVVEFIFEYELFSIFRLRELSRLLIDFIGICFLIIILSLLLLKLLLKLALKLVLGLNIAVFEESL